MMRVVTLIGCALQLLAGPSASSPSPSPSPANADAADFPAAGVSIGSADAPVTVIEYLSTTCSHCAAFDAATYPHVERTFLETGRIRLIIRELPTGPVLVSSASFLLARCNGRQGYWSALRRLLAAQSYVLAATDLAGAVRRAAEVIGLPEATVAPCLADEAAIADLNKRRQASLDDGIDSTPTFIFNGKRLLPGDRLAGGVYEGGELSSKQFDAAVRRAQELASVVDPQRPIASK